MGCAELLKSGKHREVEKTFLQGLEAFLERRVTMSTHMEKLLNQDDIANFFFCILSLKVSLQGALKKRKTWKN